MENPYKVKNQALKSRGNFGSKSQGFFLIPNRQGKIRKDLSGTNMEQSFIL